MLWHTFDLTGSVILGANSYVRDPEAASQLFESKDVDAVEIHTTARFAHIFLHLTFC